MTYSELIAKIPGRTHRADLANEINGFIALFERHAERELRVAEMEATATTATTDAAITLPADYLEMRSVRTGNRTLEYVTPDRLLDRNNGTATAYTLTGTELKTNANCTVEYTYYRTIPPLTVSAPSNWLSTKHEDAYLFGVMTEAGIWTADAKMTADYMALRDRVIDRIRHSDKGRRWSGAPLRVSASNKTIV